MDVITRKSTLDQPRLVSVPDLGAVDEPPLAPSSKHQSHRVSIAEQTDLRSVSDDEDDERSTAISELDLLLKELRAKEERVRRLKQSLERNEAEAFIVRLVKKKRSTRTGLELESKSDELPTVKSIVAESLSDGELKVGDTVISVNGVSARGHQLTTDMLRASGPGELTIVIERALVLQPKPGAAESEYGREASSSVASVDGAMLSSSKDVDGGDYDDGAAVDREALPPIASRLGVSGRVRSSSSDFDMPAAGVGLQEGGARKVTYTTVVRLEKQESSTRTGLELESKSDEPPTVKSIVAESLSDGELKVGDTVISVNGVSARGHQLTTDMLRASGPGELTIVIERVFTPNEGAEQSSFASSRKNVDGGDLDAAAAPGLEVLSTINEVTSLRLSESSADEQPTDEEPSADEQPTDEERHSKFQSFPERAEKLKKYANRTDAAAEPVEEFIRNLLLAIHTICGVEELTRPQDVKNVLHSVVLSAGECMAHSDLVGRFLMLHSGASELVVLIHNNM